jgi:NAD(P)-dependent dehydrogenase (short-subunit alcohol dehydrogenase family)
VGFNSWRVVDYQLIFGSIDEGAYVHLCSRSEEDVKKAIFDLTPVATTSSGAITGAIVDVSKPAQIEAWVKDIVAKEGRLDVIVSNVSSLSVANDTASWIAAFNTDMMGTVSLVNASLPHLEETKGAIITISSVSGREVDFTATSPYGTFKAAVIHYTAQLAHTLAPKGVRANTVSPGNIYIEDGVWGGIEKGNPELFKAQFAKNPMGRMGKASEIADAVVFLASERASFISGTNLVVDGSLCTGVQF